MSGGDRYWPFQMLGSVALLAASATLSVWYLASLFALPQRFGLSALDHLGKMGGDTIWAGATGGLINFSALALLLALETCSKNAPISTLYGPRKTLSWQDFKKPRRVRPALAVLALCGVAVLSACARGGSPARSVTPAPQPTAIIATPGNTAVCAAITPADFARVSGTAATQMTSGVTTDGLTGLREVYCLYLDTSDPQQAIARGTINFELAGDDTAAGQVYQLVRRSFTNVVSVPGVGDAAFSGTPGGAGGAGSGLVVRRGTLLLYLSVGGDAAARLRITQQLALLVLARVATGSG